MIHTVAAVVDVAVAKIVSVNAARRNKMKITKKQLKQIIKEELMREVEEVPFEQLVQHVVESWTQAFGEPDKITKMGSHWAWWVPVEEAESRGLYPATTNAPPAVRYPEWQFDRSSGRYRSKANPRVTYKSAVQGPGTSEVRLTFEVALGN